MKPTARTHAGAPRAARRLRALWAAVGGAAVLLAAPLPAQQASRTITYDEAIRIALERNAQVRLAENQTTLSETTVRQQKNQFLPSLSLNTSGAQSVGRSFDQGAGQVLNQTSQSLNAGLSSSVTLFNGGANTALLRQARLNRDASGSELERARQTAVYTVAGNYVTLQAAQEELRVRREDLAARQAEEQQIQTLVNAGSRSISDLYQQQATVAAARSSVVQAERAVEVAKTDLVQTLQLDPGATYDFPAPAIATGAAPSYDLNALVTRALAQRLDLRAAATRRDAAEQGIRVAQASRLPSVSVGAGYNTAFSSAQDLAFADQLDQRRGGSVSVGVSIPLFDRGATGVATQRARIEVENARIELETQRNQVGLQVRRALLDYQAAQAQLSAAEAQLRAAELALRTSQERYRVGAASLLEVTQARAAQVQAASAQVNARYNLVLQRTLIGYYVGDLSTESPVLG